MTALSSGQSESLQLAEAYRLALEQQMERGRDLAHQLVVMATKAEIVHSSAGESDCVTSSMLSWLLKHELLIHPLVSLIVSKYQVDMATKAEIVHSCNGACD